MERVFRFEICDLSLQITDVPDVALYCRLCLLRRICGWQPNRTRATRQPR